MDMNATPALSSDIERALQHAVGQANEAYTNPDITVSKKKKKKKRTREEAGEEMEGKTDGKKRRKKKRSQEGEDEVSAPLPVAEDLQEEDEPPKKKKKLKRDKSAHHVSATDDSVRPSLSNPSSSTQCSSSSKSNNSRGQAQLAGITPELLMGSSEDIMRTLEKYNADKLSDVLTDLGQASNAVDVSFTSMPSVISSSSGRASSNSGKASSKTGAKHSTRARSRKGTAIVLPQDTSELAYMLANKWMSPAQLKELKEKQGLDFKTGKFSTLEDQQLTTTIETYRAERGLSENALVELIFTKHDKNRDNTFWTALATSVPNRPLVNVYHHVRRMYHPLRLQGKWTQAEDDALAAAVAELGTAWEKISDRVGRASADCRDRYRNHISHRESRKRGPWSKEEEEELTKIVTEMAANQGKDWDTVFWTAVSKHMGYKRGRQQCRIKWVDSLSKAVKVTGQTPRWGAQDGFILVHKIDSMNINDDSEIDWKLLPDPDWNLWSPHVLQRRWLTLKRSIRGHEDMTHAEIMDILRVKKAHLPQQTVRKGKKAAVSAEAVVDSDEGKDQDEHENGAKIAATGRSHSGVSSSDDDEDE